jgi:hypothetical protein
MILNRPYTQWTATVVAVVNVIVLAAIANGVKVNGDLVAAVDAAAAAVIALLANASTVGSQLNKFSGK